MTSDVQYPVALREGFEVEAEHTERGARGLRCIECGAAMVRAESHLGAAYFRHKKVACSYRPMTPLHTAVRDALTRLRQLALPPATVTLSEEMRPGQWVRAREEVRLGSRRIVEVVLERRLRPEDAPAGANQQPDALVRFDDGLELAVEVTVTNPLSKARIAGFQARGIPCLEVCPAERHLHDPAGFWADGERVARWRSIEGLPGVAAARARVVAELRDRVAAAERQRAEAEAVGDAGELSFAAYERRDYARAYSDCADPSGRYRDRREAFLRWMRYWLDEAGANSGREWERQILKEWSARTLAGLPLAWVDPDLAWIRGEISPEYTRRLLRRQRGDIAHAMRPIAAHLAERHYARSGGAGSEAAPPTAACVRAG